jgi:ribosome-binding protein aMBF1 (putative translation factor)
MLMQNHYTFNQLRSDHGIRKTKTTKAAEEVRQQLPNGGRKRPSRVIIAVNENGYRIGMSHHNAKIPDEVVEKIRDLHEEEGIGYFKLAQIFKLSKSVVQKICNYERRAQTPMGYKTIRPKDQDK